MKGENRMSTWTGWRSKHGFQENVKDEGMWMHLLIAPPDEPNPRANHVHVKILKVVMRAKRWNYTLCSVKVEGNRIHSRRDFIQRINACTDLNLSY
ncbi:hypothetical protein ACFL3T_02450 [Patescibacteria group bacterium]